MCRGQLAGIPVGKVVEIAGLVSTGKSYMAAQIAANAQKMDIDVWEVIEAAKNALVGFGTGSSGSRLTTGNLNLYAELEEKIAKLKQTEAAIVFSSGYLANIGVISVLAVEGDLILSDQ